MTRYHGISTLALISLLVLTLGVAGWLWYTANRIPDNTIGSFIECKQAGYPVAGANPQQCTTPDGQVFRESLVQKPDQQQPTTKPTDESNTYTSPRGIVIHVDTPKRGSAIASPVKITGSVPGTWLFEANLPIDILNADRQPIIKSHTTAQGNWMTTDYVPFEATITFTVPDSTNSGFIVIRKDNPSGLAEHDDFVEIPIQF